LYIFQKVKILGLYGWTIKFFQGIYEFFGHEILKVVEDTCFSRQISARFNSTFITLIHKYNNPSSLDEYQPISLYNCVYKIVTKIIYRRINIILSNHISSEQFGFLEGRQIHEGIGVAKEGMHNIKTRKLK
jgi:hypothetical protein